MRFRSLYICLTAAVFGTLTSVAVAKEPHSPVVTALAEAARDCKAIHDVVSDLDGNTADDTARLYAESARLGDLYQGLSGLSDAEFIEEMDAARDRIRGLNFADSAYRDMARACAPDVDARIAEARAAGVKLP